MDKFVTRVHLLVTLAAIAITVPVFAFTTFVTIRERDVFRGMNEARMSKHEEHYDTLIEKVNILSGKVDALILLQQKE